MSDTEEQNICQTCSSFEPQTWRKSLCKNCFHTLDEHSPEFLAKEAEIAAKEKVAAEKIVKDKIATEKVAKENVAEKAETKPESSKSPVQTGKEIKGQELPTEATSEKVDAVRKVQRKYGAERAAAEGAGKWSWSIDLGRGYSKSGKASTTETTKEAPSFSTSPPSSSTKPSPQTSAKPLVKSTSFDEIFPTSTTTASSDTTTLVSTSKAKNVASKFESQTQLTSKIKPTSRPPEIRSGGSNVAALTGKLIDTKTTLKATDLHKVPSKLDSKDTKFVEITSKFSRTVPTTSTEDNADINKTKSAVQTSKCDDSISSMATGSQSKVSTFAKDLLKTSKDSLQSESGTLKSAEKTSKSSSSIAKSESFSENSLDKHEVLCESSAEKSRELSTSSLGAKTVSPKSKIDEMMKGKESIKDNLSKDLSPTLLGKENATGSSKSTSENVLAQGKVPEKGEDVSIGVKVEEVGQGTPRTNINLAGNVEYPGRDTEHAEAGIVRSSGHLANCTVPRLVVTSSADSGIKESVLEFSDKDDGTESLALSPLSDSKGLPDVASRLSQAKETSEVVQKDTTTSVSSSPTGKESISTTTSKDSTPDACVSPSRTTDTSVDENTKHFPLVTTKDDKTEKNLVEEFSDLNKQKDSNVKNKDLRFPSTDLISLPVTTERKDESADDTTKKNEKEEIDESADNETERLNRALNEKDNELSDLAKQMSKMEEQMRVLQEERDQLKAASMQSQKEDLKSVLCDLRSQLSLMEEQCLRLEKDNQSLIDKLHVQEARVKHDQECRGKNSDNIILEEDLEAAEKELEDVKDENKELQSHIMEMKNEMNEMYDHFREHEHEEFRELQKELDITAKNCRILQFKLRKAERRNEQVEQDRAVYEDKLRALQDQFDSQDAKDHIRLLEDELRMAKEVYTRLHDELDVLEDKKNKALEESRHLTELLEHTDKRQFRMEMEIDKLRDVVSDLKRQLKEAQSGKTKEGTPDRKVLSTIYTRSID